MKEKYTHIAVVLDRSGSMHDVQKDTIGSLNSFLKDQQKEEGGCTFKLVQFDDLYEVVQDFLAIKDVPALDDKTFVPRGMTALLDAIGKTINNIGQKFDNMDEKDRPERVIFVILTDGIENHSREFTREANNKMITHQTEKYNWQFLFLGADQNAIVEGGNLGIKAGNSMTIMRSSKGMQATMTSVGAAVTNYRNMAPDVYACAAASYDAFTDEDRKIQDEEIKKNSTKTISSSS